MASEGIYRAQLIILIKDDQSSIKISLTSLDDIKLKLKSQLEKLKQFDGNDLDLLINLMAEGDKIAVESVHDTIISQISKDVKFTVKIIAGFTRVPDKPKPTLWIGN
jgi:hypothetical protein